MILFACQGVRIPILYKTLNNHFEFPIYTHTFSQLFSIEKLYLNISDLQIRIRFGMANSHNVHYQAKKAPPQHINV